MRFLVILNSATCLILLTVQIIIAVDTKYNNNNIFK